MENLYYWFMYRKFILFSQRPLQKGTMFVSRERKPNLSHWMIRRERSYLVSLMNGQLQKSWYLGKWEKSMRKLYEKIVVNLRCNDSFLIVLQRDKRGIWIVCSVANSPWSFRLCVYSFILFFSSHFKTELQGFETRWKQEKA